VSRGKLYAITHSSTLAR